MSTTSRILIAFLSLLALGLLLLESQLARRVQRQYLEAIEEPMVDAAQLFASLLEQQVDGSGSIDTTLIRTVCETAAERQFSAQIYNLTKTTLDTHLYVTDRHGIVLFDSSGAAAEGEDYGWRRDVALTLAGQYGARASSTVPGDPDSAVLYVAAPIRHAGAIVGVVSVSKPVTSVYPFRDETRAWVRNLCLALLVVVTAGAYFIVTHFSRPIRALTSYARSVARGERTPPPRGGTTEVATLARAFEEMRDALDGRKYAETYVQSLTHEMKSPIAAIRGAAELLREEMPAEHRERFLANIDAESRRLQDITDRLLGLSAIESRKTLDHPEPVRLADLARAVCAQLQPAAEARRVRLEVVAAVEPIITGEPFLLEIAIANLLQNALNFSPTGGLVRAQISRTVDAGWVELRVEDEGLGIPEYALPRIFERFYSLSHPSTGRKSSGLGLCFVREAAELHGGAITVSNRRGETGACAVMRLREEMPAA